MKKIAVLLIFFMSVHINAQSNFKIFLKSSCPIKTWVVFHPFKAKKALEISLETNKVADSISKTSLLDGDTAGGQVDAFRHAFWMARLHQKIGERAARSLGIAHEKENYVTFKKNNLEDGVVPDEISSTMDLCNNDRGLKLISKRSKVSKNGLIFRVVNAIKGGKFKVIKKNKEGSFLTCDGKIIKQEELKGKWKNNKCLVASDQID
ncbi:DUF6973 domain-containing protein [Polaribacter sp.]|jgi:hypothetical protein|uniref:DUF6973 domain-containing protein n=1 Tax=Polaribacter sp. TaxID=1920175 RepID=UPI003F4B83C0